MRAGGQVRYLGRLSERGSILVPRKARALPRSLLLAPLSLWVSLGTGCIAPVRGF